MTETAEGSRIASDRRRTPSVSTVGGADATLYRHPADVARFIFSLLILGLLLLVGRLATDGLLSFSIDLLALVDGLPDAIADGLVGLVQLIATITPVVVAVVLVFRRNLRLLFVLVLAAVLAAIGTSLLSGTLEESIPINQLGYDTVNSWFVGSQYPSTTFLAALTAVLVALSPWLTKSWRIVGWMLIVGMLLSRIVTATAVPLRGGLMLAVGGAAGSLALILFGAPRRRIDVDSVAEALRLAGVRVDSLTRIHATGPDPLFAAQSTNGPLRIKVLGRDQRDADLLITLWRTLTVKGLGTESARVSPAQAVRSEALASGMFRQADGRVPAPVALVQTPDEVAVLAMTQVPGVPLADCAPGDVSAAALHDLWTQVAGFQQRRLAHGTLDPQNVLIDGDQVWLPGLRRASLQSSDEVLGADVAELLATLALTVGVHRAVRSAASVLPTDVLERAVPMIQSSVFSARTRDAVDDQDELLQDLRDEAADAIGMEHVELAPVQRITLKGTVSLVGSGVLVFYIFSLASDWEAIWDAFQQSDSLYTIPILLMAMSTYFTGAWSLMGAVPIDLPYLRTTAVMFGQSFLNRFTPANAGGMAMRIRYLQLSGLDSAVAATSIGLTSAASGVAQALTIVIFLFWGGASDRFSDFEMPDIGTIVIIILVVGLIASVIMMSTWGRRVIVPWAREVVTKIRGTLTELASDPGKMTLLFGGAFLGKLANITAFWLSCQAFGIDISFPKAGALYIIATTIGSAVPTPGGVGGVEAALTAALLSFGVDNATAAAVVLYFRILTFWLPTLPGYFFMRYTQRAGIV